jgi:hypothetical protein
MRIATVMLLGIAAAVVFPPGGSGQQAAKTGDWEAELRWRPRQNQGRVLWIDFEGRSDRGRRRGGDFGFMMKVSELSGLEANDSRWSGPARFELRRDAGVLRFEGRFEDGWGEGTYRFEPDGAFLRSLDLTGADRLDNDELLAMLIHDVRTDWVTGLQQAGTRRIDADDLIAMRIHGVTPEFVREIAGLGYRDVSPDKLVALRIHNVDPDFIRGIRQNVDPAASLNDLVSFRIHKVTPAFVREVADLGYTDVDPDDLVAMRIHGVTPGFIRSIFDLGLKPIDLDDLVAFRIHGVDVDYIKEATAAGVRLDADDLVDSKIHERRWKRRR